MNLFNLISSIFFYPKKEEKFKEIYHNKTVYYKKDLSDFYLDKAIVCLEYEENLKNFLKNFKFQYNKLSYKKIMRYFYNYWDEILDKIDKKNVLVCGVPLHFLSYIKRWYNQTYLIAWDFASEFSLEFIKPIYKSRYTTKQSKLTKKERLKNLENVFKIKNKYKDKLSGKTVILLDDVISTGTTANEVAKILKQNWARQVIGLFLSSWN